jgi:hypothetical protein
MDDRVGEDKIDLEFVRTVNGQNLIVLGVDSSERPKREDFFYDDSHLFRNSYENSREDAGSSRAFFERNRRNSSR